MQIAVEAAILIPGVVRVGALRVPVFGVFAAVGLVGALWLSQRTAKAAGVDADKLWDAGMFAVAAALVVSRVLVVAMDVRAFMAYPMLVLSLPSLTYGGIALTCVLVWLWLRWKSLRVLSVLDAWAPCAMVLWAALSLGHFVEGTDAGMPTKLPWGVVTPGDSVLGKVHPVQIYALVVAVVLCMVLLQWMFRLQKLSLPRFPGTIAGTAMVWGGASAFFLDMLRQPMESMGNSWLDPEQWIALAVMLAGAWLWKPARERSREEVAQTLDNFLNGGGEPWDWDDFCSERFSDPVLLEIQRRCSQLDSEFPSSMKGHFCSEEGEEVIRRYAFQLRNSNETSMKELV